MCEFKQIKDLYLRIVAPRSLFIEFMHEVRSVTRLPIAIKLREGRKSLKFIIKDFKGARLNAGVYRVEELKSLIL